jgi:hypothetical protein
MVYLVPVDYGCPSEIALPSQKLVGSPDEIK